MAHEGDSQGIQKENSYLSSRVGKMEKDIAHFKEEYTRIWGETESVFPELGQTYSVKEQQSLEKEFSLFIDEASHKMNENLSDKDRQKLWMEYFRKGLKKIGKRLLGVSDPSLHSVLRDDFFSSTKGFVDKVKEFDPAMKIDDVYQALRNVWIMNSLQLYLKREISQSNAIFAYSLIYPYTDNYFDDNSELLDKKLQFTAKLKDWLEGKDAAVSTIQEEKVFKLIKLIEQQFERSKFSRVYQSLLAIYNAQIKSLTQQKKSIKLTNSELLQISFEKGGTSVLADGFLVGGALDAAQADFCFGFGVFLQLGDDIQDAAEDRKNGHQTIFSQAAGRHTMDELTNKLFHFILGVTDRKLDETRDNERTLKELITKNCFYLILEAIGKNQSYFSRDYVKKIQPHFPIRFSYLQKLRQEIKEKFVENRKYALDLNFASAVLLTLTSRTMVSGIES
jgi:hypothetical protein